MMNRQRGVTLSGLLLVSVVLIFVLLLGFKLFTPYAEYFAIQKVFKTLAQKPEVKNGGKREFIQAWASYAQIERISAFGGDEIEITRDGTNVYLSASYTVKVPLFKNISLVIDFNPTSGPAP
jgi:hypothetical protein